MNTKPSSLTNGFDEFCEIDRSDDPRAFVRFMDLRNGNEELRFCKQYLIGEILRPQPGESLLDVGCGVGHDSIELAKLVGQQGHVVGIDSSRTLIREAKRRSKTMKHCLDFRHGDAQHLGFPDETFDGCLVASVFMHLDDPKNALREMVRVLKPGGRLVVLESDWDTLGLSFGNVQATKRLVKLLRQSVQQSGIGHQLPVLFWEAGLRNIGGSAGTLLIPDYSIAKHALRIETTLNRARKTGVWSPVQVEKMLEHLQRADEGGFFFGTATGFMAWAMKPLHAEKHSA